MSGVNKAILLGNLGKDPEIRRLDDGRAVANFSIATSESYKNKAGEKVTNTEWHNIVAWNKLADFVKKYVVKGQLLYLEGRIHSQTWVDKNNIRQNKKEIICDNITPLDWKNKGL